MNHRNGWASPNQLKPLREKTGVSGGRTPAPGHPWAQGHSGPSSLPCGVRNQQTPCHGDGVPKTPPPPPPHSAPRGSNLLENLA